MLCDDRAERDITIKGTSELFANFDDIDITIPYDIQANNEEKRIRVYESQILDTLIENSKSIRSFWFNMNYYVKARRRLLDKYPHRLSDIRNINIDFITRMQYIFKVLTKKVFLAKESV